MPPKQNKADDQPRLLPVKDKNEEEIEAIKSAQVECRNYWEMVAKELATLESP